MCPLPRAGIGAEVESYEAEYSNFFSFSPFYRA